MDNYLNHPAEYNRLMETARKRAVELRGDAVDDLWGATADAAGTALRAATRLAHSIVRHSRLRRNMEA